MEELQRRPEVVVITGATAGVGRALARRFAQDGACIGLLARDQGRLESTRQEIEAMGGRALAIPTDVAFPDQIEAAAQQVEDAFGPINTWINNAMTSVFGEFMDVEPDEYRRVTDVVYHGQIWGTRSALKRMLPRDSGAIVFVGSALAYRGIPLQSAYCGAKHATQGFFDSLRSELLHHKSGVRISMVQLPAVNTPQFEWVRSKLPKKAQPVPPIYQPEIAADAIYYAAHHDRREMWVGYSSVQAIAGNKVAPAFADHYLASNGYSGQQTDEPEEKGRPDNLYDPVPGDYSAHGRFDDRATSTSPQLWATKNKHWLTLAGAGLAGLATTLLVSRK